MAIASSYNNAQKIALAYMPKPSAFLSLFGVSWIIMEVLRDKRKQESVYHRLMLGYCVYTFSFMLCNFLSTWPVPADTQPEKYKPHAAYGTTATCTAQGFFTQLGSIGSISYVAALAVYYVLVVRYNRRKHQLVKLEKICHPVIACVALGTSVTGLFLKLYNNALLWCWIDYYPYSCEVNEDIECTRGINASYYVIFFGYIILAPVWTTVFVCMVLLYRTARRQATKMKQYASGSHQAEQNLNEVTKLAVSYLSVFVGFNVFFLVIRTLEIASQPIPFAIAVLGLLLTPLTGFGFVLIYLRPRFEKHIRSKSGSWKWINISRMFQWSGVDEDDHKLGTHEDGV